MQGMNNEQTFIMFFLLFMTIVMLVVMLVVGSLAMRPIVLEGHGQVSNVSVPFLNATIGNIEGSFYMQVPSYMLWGSGVGDEKWMK